jgi:hypothetical protein
MFDNCILLVIRKIFMIIYCINEGTFLNVSQIFYYLAGGIGLLLAGIGAMKYFFEWVDKNKKNNEIKKLINELKIKYPILKLNKEFKLVFDPYHTGRVMILDFRDKGNLNKRWIGNPHTFRTLDFTSSHIDRDFGNVKDKIAEDKEEYDKYKELEPIYIEEFLK